MILWKRFIPNKTNKQTKKYFNLWQFAKFLNPLNTYTAQHFKIEGAKTEFIIVPESFNPKKVIKA